MSDLIEQFRETWQTCLDPKMLSIIKITTAFYDFNHENQCITTLTLNFSALLKKAGISSSTLTKALNMLIKKGFVKKERMKNFPWESTYHLNAPKEIETIMKTIYAYDNYYAHLIKGAINRFEHPEKIIEKALKKSNLTDLWIRMDPSWLEKDSFELIKILFSALSAITFWGLFFTVQAVGAKKAAEILKTKGLLEPSEKELLERVLQIKP